MNTLAQRFFQGLILATGLLVFSAPTYALQDAKMAKPAVKAAVKTIAKAPSADLKKNAAKPVNIVSAAKPVTFKQKLAVFNRAKQDSDKLYCREDRMTGSHRKQMRCITYRDKQLEEDAARDFFRSLSRSNGR